MRGSLLAIVVLCSVASAAFIHNKRVALQPVTFLNEKSTLFQGTNDYVTIGEPADITLNLSVNEITISAWVKASSFATLPVIFAKTVADDSPNYRCMIHSSGMLLCYFGNGVKTAIGVAGTMVTGTWYHVAFTVQSIAGVYTGRCWLNGVQQGLDVITPGVITAPGVHHKFGGVASATRWLSGSVDEVTYWSVGFNSTEVLELYHAGKPNAPTAHSRAATLLHHYRMGDQDTYPTVLDKKQSDNGTLTGMVDGATNFTTDIP